MGCAGSKHEDLPAVALCRDRCHFLEEAIRQRYALADAHVAYIQSLKGVGLCLHRLFDQGLDSSLAPLSPVLPLPTQRKGDPVVVAAGGASSPPPFGGALGHHSHSNSGSHIQFHSDSDDDDGDSGSLHHSGNSTPFNPHGFHPDYRLDQEPMGSFPGDGFMNMNFMRNRPAPSVSYEQQPMSSETVHVGESSYYPYTNPDHNPSSQPYYGYSNNGGGFGSPSIPYGSSSPPPATRASTSSASSSKPPPPPPSPPRSSAWDFLNPFDTFEKFYPSHTPSRDSKEVRDEEGIPDLEDEEYGDHKLFDGGGNYSKNVANDAESGNDGKATLYQTRQVEKDRGEYEVPLVDKKVVSNGERREDRGNVAAFKAGSRGVSEVVAEIKIQFERASESGNEVSKILEVGKLPYHRKKAVYQVSSKMLHVITPSLSVVSTRPSASKTAESSVTAEKSGSAYLDFDEDVGMLRNISSTLQKLFIWEKKLYDEVKAEEKMRVMLERKCQRLKQLDEKGAEAHKVDSTRTIIRTLSTKIRIAIQVVDKISVKINKLRDEELWPQINELVHGLVKMWKDMLECHRNQCLSITEAKNLDAIVSSKMFSSSAPLEATVQLEHELLNLILSFSSWIGAQKGYVSALNSWLRKCLIDEEPEETPDGIPPFSPGRIGAPPIFVICHQWSQAMERISEKEVVDAMLAFAASLRHNIDMCRRGMASGDMERKFKALEREENKALEKKMALISGQGSGLPVPGHIMHQSDWSNNSSLQSGLTHIFNAMERFTENSMQAYEELQERSSEEERLARENIRAS